MAAIDQTSSDFSTVADHVDSISDRPAISDSSPISGLEIICAASDSSSEDQNQTCAATTADGDDDRDGGQSEVSSAVSMLLGAMRSNALFAGMMTTTAGRAAVTVPASMLSSTTASRTPLMSRASTAGGDCGKVHEHGDGGAWNGSTLPIWKIPACATNRLFDAIKESRPGREPRGQMERGTPPLHPPRLNFRPVAGSASVQGTWNASTLPSFKPDDAAESNASYEARRLPPPHLSTIDQHGPSKKAGASAQSGMKAGMKAKEEWNSCTTPEWKPTFKFNQFDYITDTRASPVTKDSKYAGVKAQYLKPSKRYFQQRKERAFETQRREAHRQLDMKYYYNYD